jgi:hypothetical protein
MNGIRQLSSLALLAALVLAPVASLAQVTGAAAANATAPNPTTPSADDEARKVEAKNHFDIGLSHLDRSEWSAALAEFLRSRELFPTRSASKNAAFCLRKEGRFDEALDMYEALVAAYPDLPPADKTFVTKEISELQASIGSLEVKGGEPGASVIVDGRERGTLPLAAPLRVSAGSHALRVYREGFLPYEGRFELAGGQARVLEAKLGALTRGGRLRVSEQTGRVVDVVVDSVVVGKTPWEGTLAVGEHTVVLRGEGTLGTQPASAPVRLNQLTPLTLVAEELEVTARVEPTPANATVAIDGVSVGRGVWDGKLRAGGHKIEAAAEGFLPVARELRLSKGQRQVLPLQLERDPSSPLWGAQRPARFVLDVGLGMALGVSYGGDVLDACSNDCSAGVPLGVRGVIHAAYELGFGLGFGLDAGYLYLATSSSGRGTSLQPVGLPAIDGKTDDKLRLSGITLGAAASFHRGEAWPFTLRLGAGVLFGSAADKRTGTFTDSAGDDFRAGERETGSATYFYVAPEVRIAKKFGSHFELSAGAETMIMTALTQPKWTDEHPVAATPDPLTQQGDGLATFGNQTITGSLMVVVVPGVAARYAF